MFSGTPYKQASGVAATPFASPSFSSVGSSFKRKRDQIDRSDRIVNIKSHVSTILNNSDLAGNDNEEVFCAKLFTSGDVLTLRNAENQPVNLSLFHGGASKKDSRVTNIAWPQTQLDTTGNMFDVGKGFNDSVDLISCSKHGNLILVNITGNNAVSASEHIVRLGEETERVTSLCHAGNVLLLGTSSEDLYLVRRDKQEMSADRLQRTQSLFMGLLQSGAKLIGMLPNKTDRSTSIVRLLPIPMSHLLISVGNTLTLWSEWSSPGNERVVWEHKLKHTIRNDIRNNLGVTVTKLRLVDACLMQTDPGAKKAVLLVLSVSTAAEEEEQQEQGGFMGGADTRVDCTLWMHTLEILTPPTGHYHAHPGDAPPVSVMHRVLVGDHVQFNMTQVVNADGSVSQELGSTLLKPKIVSLSPSWRVYVSFSAQSERTGGYTLHAGQFDVLNQPVVKFDEIDHEENDHTPLVSGVSKRELALRTVRSVHCLDTNITATSVMDTAVVVGMDGVCTLLQDGTVLLVSPPLPERIPGDFPLKTAAAAAFGGSTVKERHTAGLAKSLSNYDPEALLMTITAGETQESAVAMRNLRDVLAALSPREINKLASDVSERILARAPTGQYWGTSSAARGLTGQALTRYQMVHRLVADKLDSHKRLVGALMETNALSYHEVAQSVLLDHQQLLLCAGLSSAVQECQQRLTNSTTKGMFVSDASPQKTNFLTAGLLPDRQKHSISGSGGAVDPAQAFSEASHKESLRVVANGMDIAVRRVRGLSVDEIESQGLSIVDKFYSEANKITAGVQAIATAFTEAQAELSSPTALFHASYGVASILLSAFTAANQGEGAILYQTSILCSAMTRVSLLEVVQSMQGAINRLEGVVPSGFSLNREGKRVKELCSLILLSYVIDATQAVDYSSTVQKEHVVGSGEGGEHMSAEWKAEYHQAKTACVTLLLSLRHANAAFALSEDFLFFSGLMEAADLDWAALYPQLQTVVRTKGDAIGTDNVPLATACFLWLEENNRPAVILELGTQSKVLLDNFLETRPQWAWMNHLRASRHAEATHAAVDCARHVPSKAKGETLLSIAKLSSILALSTASGSDRPKAKTLQFMSPAQNKSHAGTAAGTAPAGGRSAIVSPSPFALRLATANSAARGETRSSGEAKVEDAVTELKANLAVIRGQEILQELCPSEFKEPDQRLPVSDLVRLVIRIVDSQQDVNEVGVGPRTEEVAFSRPIGPEDVVQCFGVGLSLLHMELEVLEAMNNRQRRRQQPNGGNAEVDLTAQMTALRTLLVSLWAAMIRVQREAWLQLSLCADLSGSEEQAIRDGMLLYQALTSARIEAAAGRIRQTLLPECDGELMDTMIHTSEVASLKVNAETGLPERISNADTARNERVVHVIKVCLDMAIVDTTETPGADGSGEEDENGGEDENDLMQQ